MLRWLNRLFRQREAVETASAPSPAPAPPQVAPRPSTPSDLSAVGAADGEAEKETCPTCGRTSVFAGPPGQRFCTYCALRDELFEAKAAASE